MKIFQKMLMILSAILFFLVEHPIYSQIHYQAVLAILAYRRFRKGIHSAGLNYGECFSYALASLLHEPLLYTGEDFSKTDLPGFEE